MILVIGASFLKRRSSRIDLGALFSFASGIIAAYLMNRERMRAEDTSALLNVRVTGWFWLGLCASISLGIAGAIQFLRNPKEP
jgi:hypothetical protein